MVCHDGAPLQLAVAVGTYTIALFGSSSAETLLPPKSDKVIGIQSPSGQIADIQPQDVLAQIWRG
jgi:ADP-heptose:LPS heptosyltransferase